MSKRKKIAATVRAAVYIRDQHTCQYCGREFMREERHGLAPMAEDGTWLELDHIEPLEAGGSNLPDNLRAACTPCNRRKSAWVTEEQWETRFRKARSAIGRSPNRRNAEKVIGELLGRPFSMDTVDYHQAVGD